MVKLTEKEREWAINTNHLSPPPSLSPIILKPFPLRESSTRSNPLICLSLSPLYKNRPLKNPKRQKF